MQPYRLVRRLWRMSARSFSWIRRSIVFTRVCNRLGFSLTADDEDALEFFQREAEQPLADRFTERAISGSSSNSELLPLKNCG